MKKLVFLSLVFVLLIGVSFTASAHFQLILPTDETINSDEAEDIGLQLIFTHPMEASHTMDMEKPIKFGVFNRGHKKNLLDNLNSFKYYGGKAWKTNFQTRSPGDYVFYLKPSPYYEKSEDKYITQYTKVVVNKMGVPTDWDAEIGMKAEIIPLTRPNGIWSGNVFRGIVKKNGKPVPYAEIEVEYLNSAAFSGLNDAGIEPPADSFVTQVVKADENGVFSYGIPKSGWWGFAALMEGEKIKGKSHEIGAVMWIKAHEMK